MGKKEFIKPGENIEEYSTDIYGVCGKLLKHGYGLWRDFQCLMEI